MVAFKVIRCIPKISTTTYRLAITPPLPVHASEEKNTFSLFNVNDTVKNIDGLLGVIQSKDDVQLIVRWQDNTIERVRKANLDTGYLTKSAEKIDIQIEDTSNSSSENNTAEEETSKVDLQKIKEAKKIKDLEDKLANKEIMQVKENAANELVSLAVAKGMIDEIDTDIEVLRVIAMSDDEFKNYQQQVLNYQQDTGEVASYNVDEVVNKFAGLSEKEKEAQEELHKLKLSGKYMAPATQNITDESKRSLLEAKEHNAVPTPVSMEEEMLIKFGNMLNTPSNNSFNPSNAYPVNTHLDDPYQNDSYQNSTYSSNSYQSNAYSSDIVDERFINDLAEQKSHQNKTASFLNTPFEGITRPLSLGNDMNTFEPSLANTNFNNLLNQLDWSTPYSKARK